MENSKFTDSLPGPSFCLASDKEPRMEEPNEPQPLPPHNVKPKR
jgi:hypothetical protein